MKQLRRTRYWGIFVAAAIAVHLLLFISIRQSFFSLFGKAIRSLGADSRIDSPFPEAILTIPIEMEKSKTEVSSREYGDEKKEEPGLETPTTSSSAASDAEELLGGIHQPLPPAKGSQPVVIPPRPIEITWPDTRRLKHCLGKSIDLRILVESNGDIVQINVSDEPHPRDCIKAALQAAREIAFVPGTINGKPSKMWTHLRIDFREKP